MERQGKMVVAQTSLSRPADLAVVPPRTCQFSVVRGNPASHPQASPNQPVEATPGKSRWRFAALSGAGAPHRQRWATDKAHRRQHRRARMRD